MSKTCTLRIACAALIEKLPAAQRDLASVLEHQKLSVHPFEIAGLALHAAVVAIRRTEAFDYNARVQLARTVLEGWAERLDHEEPFAFLASRVQIYEQALQQTEWPVTERAARTLLEVIDASTETDPSVGTVLGLMVVQYCGIFAGALEDLRCAQA